MVEEQPKWRTGKICYVEIPAVDVARSAGFYQQAFGWKIRQRGDGSTSFDDTVGEVSGTFVVGRPPATEPGFGVYIMVADAEATLAAVQAAGGEIVRPVDPAAGEVFAWFKDPGGNILGVYQQPGLAQTEAASARQTQASTPETSALEASALEASALEASALEASALEVSAPKASALENDAADLGRMLDLATPWCLHVAATLRIAEHISAGHTGIAELAAAAGCDRDALHAVLGHLVSKGVFTEESPGRFGCNRAAGQLKESSFLDLEGIGGRMAHTWGTLLDYVRTGEPAYQQVFGLPFWEDLAAHPRIAADFDALMGPAGHGLPDFDIELSGGWDPIRTVVDVGGGTGSMLASLLRRHPLVRGILVDLPGTAARAAEIMLTGRDVPAVEAAAIGLVSSVVPGHDLLDACYDLAARIAAFSRPGVELTKRMLWSSLDASSLETHMDAEGTAQLLVRTTTRNFEEAVAARKAGRPPVFKD